MSLENIKTVMLLMFENRSFDHMLGHLSYQGLQPLADGLKNPLAQYENLYKGGAYLPFPIQTDLQLPFDLPHEFNEVKIQLARSSVNGKLNMDGFVEAYAMKTGQQPNPESEPMGFFTDKDVPVTSFLAREFCTCDRWFSSVPSSTQPNRSMAFCGEIPVHQTKLQGLSANGNIFKWMNDHKITWRVYHDGFSFFTLYPKLWRYVLGPKFRNYKHLYSDMLNNDVPQVILVEPSYHGIGPGQPNDNHAPLAIGWGEDFLRKTYQAAIVNPEVWKELLMVVYYDEHGGFYDHVPPPACKSTTTEEVPFNFDSLGVRIPGILISPWVRPGSVCNELFDHTSVLQFLAEKFTPGIPYSPDLEARANQSPKISSISVALSDQQNLADAPQPDSAPILVRSVLGDTTCTPPTEGIPLSFELSARDLMARFPEKVRVKYPELFRWRDELDLARKRTGQV